MHIDDQELIDFLRAAVEDRTEVLRYRRPLPRLPVRYGARTRSRLAGMALAVAAASAVLALLGLPGVLGVGARGGAEPAGAGASAVPWTVTDHAALEAALADPEGLRGPRQVPASATLGAVPGASVPPYPVEVTVIGAVPGQAVRYRPLDGYDGHDVRGWIGIRPTEGATVWLQYRGQLVTQITARTVLTGEVLARLLLREDPPS